ncbi:phosphosulfolactate synthase [Rhodobacteraceae bacterium M382]|nr:phosphosulfolactate synthase [Rhodobacteraceae bacterium M382]
MDKAKINAAFPAESLIYELPVDIRPGFTASMKHKMALQMIATLGTHVNLANVEHHEVYLLECLRCGIGGDTNHPHGALRMAMASAAG